ncbi:hypothetical protein ERX46_12790 [Brumimicrobium glaciale]|uniref:Tetratricopeptide repeat protein n=1 Tax=Brumimicrobium glaciale TaxID=200475 RepID=A0A4Q4KID7_9FLAO|nr:tetratricopeptide repeat protein [Brumimicrobium glaciale]RYM32925.1 hypothetical protein ERX46_12790 [Brumimicrobium glaciale]
MLNFVEISHRIDNPSMIKLEDLEELRQLAKRYPFTAIFSQLYLKGLALHKTIQFESELKNHAYKVPDRSQLFYLVHSVEEEIRQTEPILGNQNQAEINEELETEAVLEESPYEEVVTVNIPEVEKPQEELKEELIEVEAPKIDSDQETIIHVEENVSITEEVSKDELEEGVIQVSTYNADNSVSVEDNLINPNENVDKESLEAEKVSIDKSLIDSVDETGSDSEQEIEEESKAEKSRFANLSDKLKNVSDLERDILAHAISSSIFIEIDELEADTYHFEKLKKLDRPEKREEEYESASIEFDLPLNSETLAEDYISEEENVDFKNKIEFDGESSYDLNEDKKSFTSWMISSISNEAKEKSIDKKVDLSPKVKESTEKTEEKEKNKEIFTPEKRKSEFFSPLKKARESLDESRLPVSETLAKVYGAQGNYPKAIEAYEKLLLKFPEKKSFFALQIETLKRKLN